MIPTPDEQQLIQAYCSTRADHHTAQDIAQDITIALMPVVIDDTLRRAYILTIAKRLCIDNARRDKLRKTVEIPLDCACTPSTSPDDADTIRRIDDALPMLSYSERVAIICHAYVGMKTEDIAETLGVTPSTVWVHIATARKKLRQMI